MRPVRVSSEQTRDRVKWEAGEVWCHQQVGVKSASRRDWGSSRDWGSPSVVTSRSPLAVGVMRKLPVGSGWSAWLSSRGEWWLKLPKPTSTSQLSMAAVSSRRARWSNGGPSPSGVWTRAASRVTR
jgi:hypothetical protein